MGVPTRAAEITHRRAPGQARRGIVLLAAVTRAGLVKLVRLVTLGVTVTSIGISATSAYAQASGLTWQFDLGKLDGASEDVIGFVQDVEVDDEGNIYILDSRDIGVKVFEEHGTFKYSMTRVGRGPGELYRPAALALDESRNLYVLNVGSGSLGIYEITDTALIFERSIPVRFQGYDVCVMRGRVFVLGYHAGAIIHAFSPAGRHLASFGAADAQTQPVIARAQARGRLECFENAGVIITMPLQQPVARAFSEDGAPVWTTNVPEYNPIKMESLSDGGVRFSRPDGGTYHRLASLARLSHDRMLLQVGTVGRGLSARSEFVQVDSYDVGVLTGRHVLLGQNLPPVVQSRKNRIYTAKNEPYPRVSVFLTTNATMVRP